MNTRSIIIAAIATFSAAAAVAGNNNQGENFEYPQAVASAAKSRADVRTETLAARAAGQITSGEIDHSVARAAPVAAKTRAEVRAELFAARAAGQIVGGEGSDITAPAMAMEAAPIVAQARK